MGSLNKALLIGNLGRDPELHHTTNNKPVVNFSLATTTKWRSEDGTSQERTEWHRVVIFGRLAEIANEYLKKGSTVFVSGSLRTRKWQDKDGINRYTTEIVANEMQIFSSDVEQPPRQIPDGQQIPGGQTEDNVHVHH